MERKQENQEKSLRQEYLELADRYASAFSLKYFGGCDYYWVGDEVGGVAEMCDYFIDYCDMRYCIDNSVIGDELFSWMDYCVSVKMISQDIHTPKLPEWVDGNKGIGDEKLLELEAAARDVKLARMRLEELIDEYKAKRLV